EIAQSLYEFFWSDYCDSYVEAAKSEIFSDNATAKNSALAVMDHLLNRVLRLLHPFMPHITEELWNQLGFAKGERRYLDYEPFPDVAGLIALDQAKLSVA